MELVVGTSNKGKIIEISESLSEFAVHIRNPSEFGILESPQEHGITYEENALEKARFYYAKTGIATLADDSGIVIEALEKELGVHTRRWGAGPSASDEEWIAFFLNRMKHEKNKIARFICCLAYINPEGKEHIFTGSCDGTITESLEATYLPGLPISACFKPIGYDRVYSSMSVDQKNLVSHRGRAVSAFKEYLRSDPALRRHTI